MKISNLSKVAATAFVAGVFCLQPHLARAGGEGFNADVSKDTSKDIDLGTGKFSSFPFHVSVSVRGGYDDNVTLSSVDPRDSFFTNAALGVTYDFGSPRTRISLTSGVSATYYFDNGNNNSDDFSVNAYVGLSITHKATPRLTLAANLNAAYLSRPGFDTFNANFFSVDRRNQNYFQTNDKFSLGYAWTPRFSTVSSYTFGYISYDDETIARFEDRFEHTFGNEFRFLILPTTTLVAEYRLGIVNYVDDNGRDSLSHFFLAGVDHSFSPRFNVSVRAGVEVREFDSSETRILFGNVDDSRVAPYAEATVNYALAQNTSLTWVNRYSLEQPNVPDALTRQTFRTALSVRHNFTARISAGLNAAYQHDEYDATFSNPNFNEDSFDIGLSARYAINRNFSVDVGYDHTEVVSPDALFRSFSRNQVYAGVTFTF